MIFKWFKNQKKLIEGYHHWKKINTKDGKELQFELMFMLKFIYHMINLPFFLTEKHSVSLFKHSQGTLCFIP